MNHTLCSKILVQHSNALHYSHVNITKILKTFTCFETKIKVQPVKLEFNAFRQLIKSKYKGIG